MTTLELELALMFDLDYTRNLIVPCVTNMGSIVRFETDLLVLSKSNYATGIEIKVSKQDLRNDLKKKHIKAIGTPSKFDFYFSPLKYFYYAVPEELKDEALNQIPDFAGLYVAKHLQGHVKHIRIYCAKPADQISKYQWTDKERLELARLGAMRIYNLKRNILELQQFLPKNNEQNKF